MSLRDCIPPGVEGVLARNGFALLTDLESAGHGQILGAMEAFQAEFLALTRSLWDADFPIPGDSLAHFSRQWEYPYAWANAGPARGRLLDAGSGITFFPFLLAAAGFDVCCCDSDDGLGLAARYERAATLTDLPVDFIEADLAELSRAAGVFDVVVCISVLEHVGAARGQILASLAEVVRPGGRLILTCDVDLRREGDLLLEDVSVLLAQLRDSFDPLHPLDLRRPMNLLTSEFALLTTPWRLPPPWRPPIGVPGTSHQRQRWRDEFRSIAILGVTAVRRG
jgi:SAM-dependent methyltransferase